MSHPTSNGHPPRPKGEDWDEASILSTNLVPNTRSGYTAAALVLLALAVLCVLAYLVIWALIPESSPIALLPFGTKATSLTAVPGGAGSVSSPGAGAGSLLAIEPQQGYIGALVSVTGQGWWPGEPVFVFLRAASERDAPRYAYAAAVADDDGRFQAAFTFPNEARWTGEQWAEVLARGNRSGQEAGAQFLLTVPTPTNTLPPPTELPTATPQLPTVTPTATPTSIPTLAPTPTPTSPPVITHWRGEYYGNMTLAGDPILVRNDPAVDFAWSTNPPAEGVPADMFSVRWTRQQFFEGGWVRFSVAADDGIRLWVDGRLVVDDWQDGPLRDHYVELSLTGGEHALLVEYYEHLGEAGVRLNWERFDLPTETPVPTETPEPTPTGTPEATVTPEPTATPEPTITPEPTATPEPTITPEPTATPTLPPVGEEAWLGQYFANPLLSGEPALERLDAEVSFDWGTDSPGEGVPPDHFSARWVRQMQLQGGTYRFSLEADDGARLWVDEGLIIDLWDTLTTEAVEQVISLEEGVHSIQVEYFEAFLQARIDLEIERLSEQTEGRRLPSRGSLLRKFGAWRFGAPML